MLDVPISVADDYGDNALNVDSFFFLTAATDIH